MIWWGPKVPASTVNQLAKFYDQQSDGVFGTPYAGLGNKIALTAWTGDPTKYYRNGYYGIGHIAVCPAFNQKAFAAFRDAYRGKGPEGIPLSSDAQGMARSLAGPRCAPNVADSPVILRKSWESAGTT